MIATGVPDPFELMLGLKNDQYHLEAYLRYVRL